MSGSGPAPRVLVFEDSIAKGFGARSRDFAVLLGEELQRHEPRSTVINKAESALTVAGSRAMIDAGSFENVTHAVVMHGATEALVRPSARALRRMPPRWRRTGWMDPRPYYSDRLRARVGQQLESELRWRTKNALIRHVGRRQIMDRLAFETELTAWVRHVKSVSPARVVLLGPLHVDPRYFPDSEGELDRYRETIAGVATAQQATFVDASDDLERWGHYLRDRFHSNAAGHAVLARRLLEHVG